MIEEISANLWTMTGPEIVFAGAPMHTRMTVAKLGDGSLWVHSPIQWSDEVASFLDSIGGQVRALIAPNKFHHLYVPEWRQHCPDATVFADERAIAKIDHLRDAEVLSDTAPALYADEISQVVVDGNRLFQEVAFFHQASKTLILTDLMINLRADNIPLLPRLFLRLEGVLYPNGGVPRLYKLLFQNKAKTQIALDVIRGWAPERVLFCHGEAFELSAAELIDREFAFLN